MERGSHAFRTNPDHPFPRVEAATYTALVSEEGLELFPHRPFHEPDGRAVLPRRPDIWAAMPRGPDQIEFIEASASWPVVASREPTPAALARDGAVNPSNGEVSARFRTRRIHQGDQTLYEPGRAGLRWVVIRNTAQALLNRSFNLVEHWEARASGMEVAWIMAKRPPHQSPLWIETELSGLSYQVESVAGHHFADASGQARLRVGHVTVADSPSI